MAFLCQSPTGNRLCVYESTQYGIHLGECGLGTLYVNQVCIGSYIKRPLTFASAFDAASLGDTPWPRRISNSFLTALSNAAYSCRCSKVLYHLMSGPKERKYQRTQLQICLLLNQRLKIKHSLSPAAWTWGMDYVCPHLIVLFGHCCRPSCSPRLGLHWNCVDWGDAGCATYYKQRLLKPFHFY